MRPFFILVLVSLMQPVVCAQFGPGILVTNDLQLSETNYRLTTADLDNDGDNDIVIGLPEAVVWIENLDGQDLFGLPDTLLSAIPMHHFELADMDGDADLDLVVVIGSAPDIMWIGNQGAGQFGELNFIASSSNWTEVGDLRCHDLTEDGQPEVLFTTNGNYVHWFVNDGGAFAINDSLQHPGGSASSILLAGDMNMDGHEDQVSINWDGSITVGLNQNGVGTSWTVEQVFTGFNLVNETGVGIQLLDADGDTDLDVVDAQNQVKWARNRIVEDGTWGVFDLVGVAPDLFTYGVGWAGPLGCGEGTSILWQVWPWVWPLQWSMYDEQLGAFTPPIALMDSIRSIHLSAADLSGDGANDLIIADRDNPHIWWFPNQFPTANASSVEFTLFDTLCASGDPYPLDHASPSGGAWSGEGVTENLFTPPNSGSFELTYQVVDVSTGCPLAASQTITAITEPMIALVSGDPTDGCALSPIQYTAVPSGGTWSGLADPNGSVDRSCAIRPLSGPAMYAMNAINGGGCNAEVGFFDLPACAPIDLGVDQLLCSNGDTLMLSLQGPAMGFVDLTGPFDLTAFLPPNSILGYFYPGHDEGTYAFYGTGAGAQECQGYDTLVVTVVAHPEAIAMLPDENNPALVCQSEVLFFDGASSIAHNGASIVDHLWSFGDGSPSATGEQVLHSYPSSGTYTLHLTVTDTLGCADTTESPLILHVSTTPHFFGTIGNATVCLGDTFLLSGVATAIPWGIPPLIGQGAQIPDLQGGPLTSIISISTASPNQILEDINDLSAVCVNMEHSFIGDLVISLTCPSGQSVVFHQISGGSAHLGVPVDDDSQPNIQGACWNYCWSPTATNGTWAENAEDILPSGTYESLNPMSALEGCELNGTWIFTVVDLWASDNGFLCDWSLSFADSILPAQNGFISTLDSFAWTGPDIISANPDPSQATAVAMDVGIIQYSFVVTDDFGCSYDTTLTISVAPLPSVTLTAPATIDIDGGPVTFTNGEPAGGSFVIDSTASATVDPSAYIVGDSIEVVYSYTDPLTGCMGADTAYVLVEQPTAIDNAVSDSGILVMPNPANDGCVVRFPGSFATRILLTDALGRDVRSWTAQRSPAPLDLSGLPAGSYLLSLRTTAGFQRTRVVIE